MSNNTILNIMPTSWSSYLAPNCALAKRFANGEVSNIENALVRLGKAWEAFTNIPTTNEPVDTWKTWNYGPDADQEAKKQIAQHNLVENSKWVLNPHKQADEACKLEISMLNQKICTVVIVSFITMSGLFYAMGRRSAQRNAKQLPGPGPNPV